MDSDRETEELGPHLTAWAEAIEGVVWADTRFAVALRHDEVLGEMAVAYWRAQEGPFELPQGSVRASLAMGRMLVSVLELRPWGARMDRGQRP